MCEIAKAGRFFQRSKVPRYFHSASAGNIVERAHPVHLLVQFFAEKRKIAKELSEPRAVSMGELWFYDIR